MHSKLNQAITLHPLFFDPVNKKALLIKKNGKEFVGYQEDRPGIIVTKDCIGYTDTHFRTISDRKHRAVAGLSLGSAQALLAAANHPDLFGALGIFSGVRTDEMKRLIVQNENYVRCKERISFNAKRNKIITIERDIRGCFLCRYI